MPKCSIFLIAIIVLNASVREGSAIRCFQCNSLFGGGCGESVNSYGNVIQSVIECTPFSNPFVSQRQQCRKIIHRLPSGGYGYIRGCNQNDHPELGLLDAEVYLCDSDACNSATYQGPILILTIATALTLILSRFW